MNEDVVGAGERDFVEFLSKYIPRYCLNYHGKCLELQLGFDQYKRLVLYVLHAFSVTNVKFTNYHSRF